MSRHIATPGEMSSWRAELKPLAAACADGVMRLLSEVVSDCAACDEPIRRCDPRRLVDGRLLHLTCAPPLAKEAERLEEKSGVADE
jgi:hypothetical protein